MQGAGCSQQQKRAALVLLGRLLQGGTWRAADVVVLLLPQLLVLVLVRRCTAPRLLLPWALAAVAMQLLGVVVMMCVSCCRGGLCWMTLCLWRCWCSRW
jgi:hypothetical protein